MNNRNNLPPEESIEPSDEKPVVSGGGGFHLFRRFNRALIRVLFVVYLIGVVAFGYWYWARPVRADQVKSAHRIWHGIVEEFGVPVPKDERW